MGKNNRVEKIVLNSFFDLLIREAIRVRENAYAPYSNFLVGCAIFTKDGTIHHGCNVESADYDGTHAEEAALATMVGYGERQPLLVAVAGGLRGAKELSHTPPCGKCRQKLYEFASLNGNELMLVEPMSQGGYRLVSISKLLPRAFGPANIGIDLSKHR